MTGCLAVSQMVLRHRDPGGGAVGGDHGEGLEDLALVAELELHPQIAACRIVHRERDEPPTLFRGRPRPLGQSGQGHAGRPLSDRQVVGQRAAVDLSALRFPAVAPVDLHVSGRGDRQHAGAKGQVGRELGPFPLLVVHISLSRVAANRPRGGCRCPGVDSAGAQNQHAHRAW